MGNYLRWCYIWYLIDWGVGIGKGEGGVGRFVWGGGRLATEADVESTGVKSLLSWR